ncbi:MAG: ATP-dependent RecD-like DNA helicase [Rickettsiaceae bacterium]
MSDGLTNQEQLFGSVERITYHNSENGFCVLRVHVKGFRELVTVVGSSPSVLVGQHLKCFGYWHKDANYGIQFKANSLVLNAPDTIEGVQKYLGSGLIKYIGPHTSKKLVEAFGKDVFDVIENNPDALRTVQGIGKVKAANICNNWKDQKVIRDIMIFLQSHSIGTSRATKIYKTYGESAISVISKNPYKLARDIHGIGFLSADAIAQSIGIALDSPMRIKAGIAHSLFEATSKGHCGLPVKMLIANCITLLDVEDEMITEALEKELFVGDVIKSPLLNHDNIEAIFLAKYYIYEQSVADRLLYLTQERPTIDIDIDREIFAVEKKLDMNFAVNQKQAISTALQERIVVITGGPGTGKTTIVNALLKILTKQKLKISLCAPTGRAAKRLSETTGLTATTIHRLLSFDIDDTGKAGFKYDQDNKLNCNYVVVDEMSMVDISLFHSLLKALPKYISIILVGDKDQLPSVGPGQVLKDIIESGKIAVVQLTDIFRQAKTSQIITNAHLINKGIVPNLKSLPDKNSDFYFIEEEDNEALVKKVLTMIQDRIPDIFDLDPILDIQVLCPMQKGGVGARTMNAFLQEALNLNYKSGIMSFGQRFALGDKVMQIRNNYDKDIYNGDIGFIEHIDQEEEEVYIGFDDRSIKYDYSDLDEITLAYAITIHKSQGSEYPAIIIPLTTQSFMMLKRNLLYTAITRAKKLAVIIGSKKALVISIKNQNDMKRYSKLYDWLVS